MLAAQEETASHITNYSAGTSNITAVSLMLNISYYVGWDIGLQGQLIFSCLHVCARWLPEQPAGGRKELELLSLLF